MSADVKGQVLQATDLVELISQTVALKRRGKDYVGLCPFHSEKTPSFTVSPGKQVFYCYGCKAGGTAFDFVMKRDRVEFREALEILAGRAGIELDRSPASQQKKGERQALYDAQSSAAVFFGNQLSHPQLGSTAREYLARRGFNDESLKRFQVGLAPDAWDGLLKGPVGKKFDHGLLALAGLAKPRNEGQGHYDTFRNRVMFPIKDEGGRIIAFGGRVMPGSEDPAKYLNSPETPIFSKSRAMYGIDLARQRIVETRTVAVVEGYTDVIMAHQFGATNVVSVLGTAMTEQHVNVLRRFADRIVLLFDADTAGDAAVNRVVQLFLTQAVEIAVATLPEGQDPDEFLLEHGLEAFDRMLTNATDALTYAWKQTQKVLNATDDLTGQQKAAQHYIDILAGARGGGPIDSIRWHQAMGRASKITGMPFDVLMTRFKTQPAQRPAYRRPGEAGRPIESAASANAEASQPQQPVAGPAQVMAERWLLGALLLEPRRWHAVQAEVPLDAFMDPANARLAQLYWDHQRDEGEPVFNEFLATLMDEGLRRLGIELAAEVGALEGMEQTLGEAVKHLGEVRRKREEQRALTELRRRAGETPAAEDELLLRLTQKASQPDPRRLGPRAGF